MVTEQNIIKVSSQAVRLGRANATIKPRVAAVALVCVPVSRPRFLPPWRGLKEETRLHYIGCFLFTQKMHSRTK